MFQNFVILIKIFTFFRKGRRRVLKRKTRFRTFLQVLHSVSSFFSTSLTNSLYSPITRHSQEFLLRIFPALTNAVTNSIECPCIFPTSCILLYLLQFSSIVVSQRRCVPFVHTSSKHPFRKVPFLGSDTTHFSSSGWVSKNFTTFLPRRWFHLRVLFVSRRFHQDEYVTKLNFPRGSFTVLSLLCN